MTRILPRILHGSVLMYRPTDVLWWLWSVGEFRGRREAGASLLLLLSVSWAGDKDKDRTDIDKRIDNSAKVLTEIMGTPDKAIPDKVMSGAKCIAVIPSMVKIAIGFGGNHGKGVASCKTA